MVTTSAPTGGEVMLEVLRNYGVEYIFASPGSEWPPIWESLARQEEHEERGPRYVNTRHEELAVAMASGYAKRTGKLPVVLLHTTVGTLHAAMALRGVYHEQMPMLICAGESVSFGEGSGPDPGGQWLRSLADVGGPARLAEPYVKWSFGLNCKEILAGSIHRACQLAMTAPQGPVFLSVPLEFMLEEATSQGPSSYAWPARPQADGESLEQAAEFLAGSRNPVIVTETAGRTEEGAGRLVELAELLGAPVVEATSPAYVNLPRNHPLHGGYDARPYLEEADLVLVAGGVGPWHPPSAGPPEETRVVVLDDNPLRPDAPYYGYRVDLWLAGDVPGSLARLVHLVGERVTPDDPARGERRSRWEARNGERRQAWEEGALATQERRPVDTRWLCHEVNRLLPEDAIVVEETITHRPAILRHLNRVVPGQYYSAMSGGLGMGMGVALGVKCVAPERPVIALIGDGAFNYNPALAGLGLCQEYDMPIVAVVFNNQGYASMKSSHQKFYPGGWASQADRFIGTGITPSPNYAELAKAFDGYGRRVQAPGDIEPALREALAAVRRGQPAVVDVVLDTADPRRAM